MKHSYVYMQHNLVNMRIIMLTCDLNYVAGQHKYVVGWHKKSHEHNYVACWHYLSTLYI